MSAGRGRPRTTDTTDRRAAVLSSARRLFAERGFHGTTMRAVADLADVDVKLVGYYFRNKAGLLDAALAPPAAAVLMLGGIEGPRERAGEELVRRFVHVWDENDELREQGIAIARVALGDAGVRPQLSRTHRSYVAAMIADVVEPDHRDLRVGLVGAQLQGLLLTRYVMRTPALTTATPDELGAVVGPAIQAYLTGPIPATTHHDRVLTSG
ncbi:TetR family transcriptional regulator [Cellulomonas chitinilytica]|uniref:TetR family transcriptional regulator n=1 Tax=Cellulomonas chitinilytica TaxID=398759 RepID=A0A919U1D2_9CELL|nr:TetR family transcriptional regulator [Cellulomonas chitinilytica]GIG20034.1 TetR family transcriptional regulator [Cellulomonas chitinilytica]